MSFSEKLNEGRDLAKRDINRWNTFIHSAKRDLELHSPPKKISVEQT